MNPRALLGLIFGAALIGGAAPRLALSEAPDFLTLHRTASGETWLLDAASGALWLQVGESRPTHRTNLVRRGSSLNWGQAAGLGQLGENWVVTGRSGKAEIFSRDGIFIEEMKVPEPVGGLVRSGRFLWFLPLACKGPSRSFWISEDGQSFLEVRARPADDDFIGAGIAGVIDSQVTSSMDSGDSIVFARLYGGPYAYRMRVDGSRERISLAYRRTRDRDRLRLLRFGTTEPDAHSSPVRDLVALGSGELVVLRNFEDVRGSSGIELRVGTVADLYDAAGRQVSSAEFPEKIRLLLRADSRRVVALCADGRVLVRPFRSPISGGLQ